MNDFCIDLILYISNFLSFENILTFSITNKFINNSFDDNYYLHLAKKKYSKLFWDRASLRPVRLSIPLNSIKLELIRIYKFQNYVYKLTNNYWTETDFFNYWDTEFHYYLKKNLNVKQIKNKNI